MRLSWEAGTCADKSKIWLPAALACGWNLLHPSALLHPPLSQRREGGLWSGVCCCFGCHMSSCLRLLSKLTCSISQITLPSPLLLPPLSAFSGCPQSLQDQHTHPLPCGSSRWSKGGMAQLQPAAFPSWIPELSHGSAPLSLSNHVHDCTNDEGLSQTSNKSPLLCRQPWWSCPSSKSASPWGLSGDALLSRCWQDGWPIRGRSAWNVRDVACSCPSDL